MAITKEKKKALVAELTDGLQNAQSVAFVNFTGLSGSETVEMRNALRAEGVTYKVIKKTLLNIALDTQKFDGDKPAMEGNIAVAYSTEDATAPARAVHAFAQDGHKEQVKLVGGVFENKYLDEAGITEIATIPDMQTLRGMFVGMVQAPIRSFAVVLSQIAEKKA